MDFVAAWKSVESVLKLVSDCTAKKFYACLGVIYFAIWQKSMMLLPLWLQERGKLSRNQIYLILFMRHFLIIEAEYFVVLSYESIILDAFKKKKEKKMCLQMLQ